MTLDKTIIDISHLEIIHSQIKSWTPCLMSPVLCKCLISIQIPRKSFDLSILLVCSIERDMNYIILFYMNSMLIDLSTSWTLFVPFTYCWSIFHEIGFRISFVIHNNNIVPIIMESRLTRVRRKCSFVLGCNIYLPVADDFTHDALHCLHKFISSHYA